MKIRNINQLSKEELENIGDILGYVPSSSSKKAIRFLKGCEGELVNWNYDEVINFGDMFKVKQVFDYLNSKNVLLKEKNIKK